MFLLSNPCGGHKSLSHRPISSQRFAGSKVKHFQHLRTLCKLALPVVAIIYWSNISLSQETFPTTDAFAKATIKSGDQLSSEARGDLNADGLNDWVGVIRGQVPDESPTYQLFVLIAKPGGGFVVSERTQKAEIPGMGCCWLEDLQIRRGSLFVQNNAKTASVMEAATHQFKLYKDQWRLIGVTIYLTDHTPGATMTKDTEMNLLTGLMIEKTKKRNNRPRTSRSTRKFSIALLKDFDFSNGFGSE
jgi:hypothetical protein